MLNQRRDIIIRETLIECMLFDKQYTDKPIGKEIGLIQNSMKTVKLEIAELASMVSKGATFRPAVLGGRSAKDWQQQQLFALDFDEGTTILQELGRARFLGINPVFAYTSFNHTREHNKFRFVFCFNEPVIDDMTRDNVQSKLMELFPNADQKCSNSDRLFFGGRSLIPLDTTEHIDLNWFSNTYGLENVKRKIEISVKSSKIHDSTIKEINYEVLHQHIFAITALDFANKIKLHKREIMDTNIQNNLYNSNQYIQLSETFNKPIEVKTQKELYDTLMKIDLCEYLNIRQGSMVRCILPEHNDRNPSAHIFVTHSGVQVYKCFGCDKRLNIVQITMKLAKCSKVNAVRFLCKLYNIQKLDLGWIEEQNLKIREFNNKLDSYDFKDEFPYLSKILRTRKKHLQSMIMFCSRIIKEELKYEDKPIFFASYETLMREFDIRNKTRLSESLTLFTLLNLVNKIPMEEIPEKERKEAISIARKYGHHKITNFYMLQGFDTQNLKVAEENAELLLQNHMTLAGLSREFVYRTFGQNIADRCFPQYKKENEDGTSKKSDQTVLQIVELINQKIEEQGYCLVKDITDNKKYEQQWRKAIAEILDSYGWKKKKINKELKEKLKIPVTGYPMVIIDGKDM